MSPVVAQRGGLGIQLALPQPARKLRDDGAVDGERDNGEGAQRLPSCRHQSRGVPPGAYLAIKIGGLVGAGFGLHPVTGYGLLMICSVQGRGVVDTQTGQRIARDRNPDPKLYAPAGPDLNCRGLGPRTGVHLRIAGLFGGGLLTTTEDGWAIDVVAPDWPSQRVLLSANGGIYDGPAGSWWWHIFHADSAERRTVGVSPSGRSLVAATSRRHMMDSENGHRRFTAAGDDTDGDADAPDRPPPTQR